MTRLLDDRLPDEDDEADDERDQQLFEGTHQGISGLRLEVTCRAVAPWRCLPARGRAREPWAP